MSTTNGAHTANGGRSDDGKVRVAIVGVGNCANSFIQGIQYYNPKIFIKYFQNSKPLPVDTVVRSERLLHCLNEKLDPREVVGFLTDVSGEAHRERFRQAQYALVPVVVDDSVDHRLVVGFFNNPDQLNLNTQEFVPVLECSPGVILFLHIGVQ